MSSQKAGDTRLLDKILGVDPLALDDDDATVVLSREAALPEDPTPPPVTDPTPSSSQLPTTEPVDVRAGVVIDGRYRVQRLVGRGGIGLVYLCHHEVLEKPVAMKVLRPEYADQPEVIERFVNEARAAAAIKSDHIVNTLDVGSLPSGAPYFIMEHVDAETLAAILQREAALPVIQAADVARQMADGLAAAHGAGIVHRDLKPENVFVKREADGTVLVKIFDFGVAKVTRAKNRLTHVGAVFGTPSYMSPEQARGQTVDPRADVYAIGIMLYEMIAGHLPFDGDDPLAVMSQHVDSAVPPLKTTHFGEPVPAAIEAVVLRCLEKNREDRYPSVRELLRDLGPQGSIPDTESLAPHPAPELLRDSQLPEVVIPLEDVPAHRDKAAPTSTVVSRPAAARPAEARPAAARPAAARPAAATAAPAPRKNLYLLLSGVAALAAVVWLVMPGGNSGRSQARTAGSAGDPSPAPIAAPVTPKNVREVHLVLSPLDAQVFLGEDSLGQMPVSVKVEEGKPRTVTIRRKGYRTRKLTLDGTQTRIVVGLNKLPAAK